MLEKVKEHIKPLSVKPLQAYFTADFQLYHLLEFILNEIGQANLILATFSVSEEFIRKLLQLKQKGLTGSLAIIADHRTAVKALRLSLFTNNVAENLHLGNNHAKIILIENENWKVSIVTSQNQTRGNRIECGVICSYPFLYDDLFNSVIKERSKMLDANEVFRGTVTDS